LNRLTHTWRYLARNKTFALVNIAGMAVSIACTLMILAYVGFHFSFDRFHDGSERMYRVLSVSENVSGVREVGGMHPGALIPAVRREIPEVEEAVKYFWGEGVTVRIQDRYHYLDKVFFAESNFFEFFDFPLLAGQSEDVLRDPNTAVISESLGRLLFREEDPVGKIIRLFNTRDFRITGVVADMPANSHLHAEVVGSILPDPNWGGNMQSYRNSWRRVDTVPYVKLFEGSDPESVQSRINEIIEINQVFPGLSAQLQSLNDVHLRSTGISFEQNENKKNLQEMYMLGAIAFMLMFAAVSNYISLTTARSMTRAVEVGIRKTSGANRIQLARQFIGETFIILMLSAVLGFVLAETIGPLFGPTLSESLFSTLLSSPAYFLWATGGLILLAILAGSYPAFVMSAYQTADVLRGRFSTGTKGTKLRKTLVVVQFSIAVCLLIGLLVADNQLNYMKNKPLGFDLANVISVPFSEAGQFESYQAFSNELNSIPEIEAVTSASAAPGLGGWGRFPFAPTDGPIQGEELVVNTYEVGEHYVDILGLNLVQGQNFRSELANSQEHPILINESAARFFQWQPSPVGKQLRTRDSTIYSVVGVVEDYHLESLQFEIAPLILTYNEGASWGTVMKIREGMMSDALEKVEIAWKEVYPTYPFGYRVYSDSIDSSLIGDEQLITSQLFQFTVIAMFIACLGLYGLASFTANEKAKEIGVRKVYGATSLSVFRLVLKEQLLLIGLAVLVACPLAFYFMNTWLSSFAFRTDLSLWNFVGGSLVAVLVGVVTISAIVWKASKANPIDALRYE